MGRVRCVHNFPEETCPHCKTRPEGNLIAQSLHEARLEGARAALHEDMDDEEREAEAQCIVRELEGGKDG